MRNKLLKIHLLTNTARVPSYATDGSAGLDLYTDLLASQDKIVLYPNQSQLFPTSLKMQIPQGFYGSIVPRGGKGTSGLVIGNLEGVVDCDYRGEVFICLWNRTDSVITIDLTKAVAQMIIKPYEKCDIMVVNHLDDTERGEGKLGNTDE